MPTDPIVAEAIEKAGSVQALAKLVGVRPQAISQWGRVPLRHVLKIEELTGISRRVIRRDIYEALGVGQADEVA